MGIEGGLGKIHQKQIEKSSPDPVQKDMETLLKGTQSPEASVSSKVSPEDQAAIDKALAGTQKPSEADHLSNLQMEKAEFNPQKPNDLDNLEMVDPRLNNRRSEGPIEISEETRTELDQALSGVRKSGDIEQPKINSGESPNQIDKQKSAEKLTKDAEQGDLYQTFLDNAEEKDREIKTGRNKDGETREEATGSAWESYLKREGELTRSGGGQVEMTDEQWEAARARWVAERNAGRNPDAEQPQPEAEAQPATPGQAETQQQEANPAEQPEENTATPNNLDANQEQAAAEQQEANPAEQSVENAAAQNNLDANQELSPEQAREQLDQKFSTLKSAMEAEARSQKDYGYFAKMANKLGLISKNSQAHEEYGKMVETRKNARKEYDQAVQGYIKALVRGETQRLKSQEGLKDDKKELSRRINSFLLNRDVVSTTEKIGDQEKAITMSPLEFINKQERELVYARKEALDGVERNIWGKMAKAVFSDAPKWTKEKLVDLREKYKIELDGKKPKIRRKTEEDIAKMDAKARKKEKKLEDKMAKKAAKGKSIEKEMKKYAKRKEKQTTAYETVAKRTEQIDGRHTLYYELMNHLEYDESQVVPMLEAFENQTVLSLQEEYGVTAEHAKNYFNWRINNVREDDVFRIWRSGSRKRLEIVGFNKYINSREYVTSRDFSNLRRLNQQRQAA